MPKAVFLDRDGTLIEDRGHLCDPAQVVFLPETFPALRRLQEEFLLFIVTNQSGVAKGDLTREQVDRVNAHVVARLAEAGIAIAGVYVCPHARADQCRCIKPSPHFLHQAAAQSKIDLGRSFSVGDHPHDVTFARAAGGEGIYVLTGHGQKHLADLPADAPVVGHIGEAAERILTLSRAEHARQDGPLRRAADALRRGGAVAFPTETVYGLGANALDPRAAARVFEIKGRPRFDPLIVHVCSLAQARQVVADWPEPAARLARRFWPGPVTLVLPKSDSIPEIVTAGLETVALRMPAHPTALALIAEAGVPVAAPSANRFGDISPTTAEHVRKRLGEKLEHVLDGGPCRVGVESTIVSLVGQSPELLRAGGVALEQIEQVVGPVRPPGQAASRVTAPGQYPRHYAPRTPLILCDGPADPPAPPGAGLLTVEPPAHPERYAAVETLSDRGDLQEAAANLFAAMHRLDEMDLDVIVAIPAPETGLGRAINDRLRRAACPPPQTTSRREST